MAVKNVSQRLKAVAGGAAKGAIGGIPVVGGMVVGGLNAATSGGGGVPSSPQAVPAQAPKGYHWSVERGKWVRTRPKRLTLSSGHLRLIEMLVKSGKSATGRMRK